MSVDTQNGFVFCYSWIPVFESLESDAARAGFIRAVAELSRRPQANISDALPSVRAAVARCLARGKAPGLLVAAREPATVMKLSDDADDAAFERFWTAFPNFGSRKAAKKQCKAKWVHNKLTKELDAILFAVKRYAEENGTKDCGTCAPLVFLNQRRWDAFADAYATARGNSAAAIAAKGQAEARARFLAEARRCVTGEATREDRGVLFNRIRHALLRRGAYELPCPLCGTPGSARIADDGDARDYADGVTVCPSCFDRMLRDAAPRLHENYDAAVKRVGDVFTNAARRSGEETSVALEAANEQRDAAARAIIRAADFKNL